MKEILSDEIVLLPESSAHRNGFGNLHTDTTTMESKGNYLGRRDEFRIVTTALYFQDNDEHGGGVRVVPGSHKKPDPIVERRLKSDGIGVPFHEKVIRKLSGSRIIDYDNYSEFEKEAIDVPSKAGDVIIFHMRLLHRASHPTVEHFSRNKIATFHRVGRKGRYTDAYEEYLLNRQDQDYAYLKKPRDLRVLEKFGNEFGFEIR